jgi:hypothetical protein
MRRALSAAALAVLAGCSALEAQRPVGNAIIVPPGWSEVPIPVKLAVNPVLGMWTRGPAGDVGKSKDFLMLMRFPSSDNQPLTEKILASSGTKDATITERKDVTLCNGSKGVRTRMHATTTSGGSSRDLDMEVVAAQGKGEALIAIYAYPMGSTPDSAAVAAVDNVCPILSAKT